MRGESDQKRYFEEIDESHPLTTTPGTPPSSRFNQSHLAICLVGDLSG